jgi:hypothetical protein
MTVGLPRKERSYRDRLATIAKMAAASMWGIPESKLDGALFGLGEKVPTGQRRAPSSRRGRFLGWMMDQMGFEYIQRDGETLKVVARGLGWPILVHELVKGTAELVSLHGLSVLDDATYRGVIDAADGPELELWHLQAGHGLWRRLEACRPEGVGRAEALMGLARLAPRDLERVMFAVVEDPPFAGQMLEGLSGR